MKSLNEKLAKELGFVKSEFKGDVWVRPGYCWEESRFTSLDFLDAEIKRLGLRWSKDGDSKNEAYIVYGNINYAQDGWRPTLPAALLSALKSRKESR